MSRRGSLCPTEKMVKQFLKDLQDKKGLSALWTALSALPKSQVEHWTDSNGLNVLHYCILFDHAEATDFLLKHGYFAKPSSPAVSPYMHLAALLGFKTTLAVLIQHRPEDFEVATSHLYVPNRMKESVVKSYLTARKRLSMLTISQSSSMASKDSASSVSPVMPHQQHLLLAPLDTVPNSRRLSPQSSLDHSEVSLTKARSSFMAEVPMDGSQPLLKTPLELAARARRLFCVKLLLDLCVLRRHPELDCKGHFTLAACADCPTALSLLFMGCTRSDSRMTDDVKRAVKVSVHNVLPACLDILLGNLPPGLDIEDIFKHINFYHVLYSFSASYGKAVCNRLPEVTDVLIRRKHDVKANDPPRTYPMYTLLTHAFCYHDQSFAGCYLECLKHLLAEGADPNFDEAEFEQRLQRDRGIKFSAGRSAFSSGLDCLLQTMESNCHRLSEPATANVVQDFAAVLISHGADPCKVGRISVGTHSGGSMEGGGGGGRGLGVPPPRLEGTVLHQVARSTMPASVKMNIVQCLVRFGAEPGQKVQEKYPINMFFDKLFEEFPKTKLGVSSTARATSAPTNNNEFASTESPQLLVLPQIKKDIDSVLAVFTRFMTHAQLQGAAFVLKKTYTRTSSELARSYLTHMLQALDCRGGQVWSLRDLTSWAVWQMCGKRMDTVRTLPVTTDIKIAIVPFS